MHIHHQVWGILLILVAAVLEFAYQPDTPWLEVLGATFGVGAALTLDEFALWVHLDDVYWSEEGRKSIDAIVVAACIGAVLLIGTAPFGVDDTVSQEGLVSVAITGPHHDRLRAGGRAQGQARLRPDRPLLLPLRRRRGDTARQARLALGPAAVPGRVRRRWPSRWRRYGERRQARIDRIRDLLGGTHGSAGG